MANQEKYHIFVGNHHYILTNDRKQERIQCLILICKAYNCYLSMTIVQPSNAAVPILSRHNEADFRRRAGVLTDARLYRHLVVIVI